MANPWISFLKSWRSKHKGVSLKDSMKQASSEYKKSKGASSSKVKKKTQKKTRGDSNATSKMTHNR